jgi:hypothetical protein
MMSLAGASRAVVPTPADCPAPLAADLAGGSATAPAADGTASAWPADVAAEPAELEEHPASKIPPASMAPPIARQAAAPIRVRLARADGRFKLSVFNMPM